MENRDPNELLHEDKPAQSCLQSCLQEVAPMSLRQ